MRNKIKKFFIFLKQKGEKQNEKDFRDIFKRTAIWTAEQKAEP